MSLPLTGMPPVTSMAGDAVHAGAADADDVHATRLGWSPVGLAGLETGPHRLACEERARLLAVASRVVGGGADIRPAGHGPCRPITFARPSRWSARPSTISPPPASTTGARCVLLAVAAGNGVYRCRPTAATSAQVIAPPADDHVGRGAGESIRRGTARQLMVASPADPTPECFRPDDVQDLQSRHTAPMRRRRETDCCSVRRPPATRRRQQRGRSLGRARSMARLGAVGGAVQGEIMARAGTPTPACRSGGRPASDRRAR